MDYERLTKTYWDEQVARVIEVRDKIIARENSVADGRVVPEDDDLTIGTGRRLEMAIMFLDVCSFSGRPSETPVEQEMMLKVLNLFFTEMVKIAEEYGGVVEKNTGDGLMAYFNDNGGTPPESGCKRAVACALTMMRANALLINPILRASSVEPLRFRIGIDHGQVTVAQIGAARRFGSLVAIGTTANVACKMLNVADPDEIIIGETVTQRLPSSWHQWCILKKSDTGWIFRSTQQPYRFFSYTGRWTNPR
jgi:class 3 adenylate cyclase